MSSHSCQAPAAVVLIRPSRFYPNPETAIDNVFQRTTNLQNSAEMAAIAEAANIEVMRAADALERAGVRTHVFDDDGERGTPDSVFPSNWFSTHHGGRIVLYPMKSINRRRERRPDVVEMLKSEYRLREVFDYSGFEYERVYLEGTGAMVLDHVARIAYCARSRRSDPIAMQRFCAHFNFEPVTFSTLHQ
jgi:hypothetical protein